MVTLRYSAWAGLILVLHISAPAEDAALALPIRKGSSTSPSKAPAETEPVKASHSVQSPRPVPASPPSTPSRSGLLSRILPSRQVPQVFNTDYKTRGGGAAVPTTIRGAGLGGRNLPIGGEDAYRKSLPSDFCPTDLVRICPEFTYSSGQPIYLRQEAARSMEQMCRDAAAQGLTLKVFSGYRDYNHQARLYAEAVRKRGKNQKTVARPGRSEHFLGTTADVTNGSPQHLLSRSFASSPEGKWLERNGWRYGWKMTVRASSERKSHADEPWHIRYVGPGTGASGQQIAARPTMAQRVGRLFGFGKK